MFNHMNSEDMRALDAARLKSLKERRSIIEKEIDEKKIELQRLNSHIEALQVLQGENDNIKPKPDNTMDNARSVSSTTAPREIAYHILKERKGADMHFSELALEVQERGGELKASDPAALLNTLLTNDKMKRFVRPYRRGHYALKEDHPGLERSVGERKPRKMQ